MKKILKSILMVASAIAITSCCADKEAQTPADALLARLTDLVGQGKIMYGHQDSFMYGHSWNLTADEQEYAKSDVKDVTGSYPMVYGLDLGGIEFCNPANLDKNNFDQMRASAVAHHERGGIITFSWHPTNPLTGGTTWDVATKGVVATILPGGEKHEMFMGWLKNAADYLESIKTADGQLVPVIFRPWHEHTGSWFWWGQDLCSTEEYVALWKMTYEYMMDERGMTNLVWSYSPNIGVDAAGYMERYPGDEYVDVFGFDGYCFPAGTPEESSAKFCADLRNALEYIVELAAEHGKIAALTECGYEGLPYPEWWTKCLYKAVEGLPLSYALTWRNAWEETMQHHFYAPFPGQESAEDFKAFAALDDILFL